MRVPGHDFVGYGEGASERAAQGVAATRFVKFLVESGLISAGDLPRPLAEVDLGSADDVTSMATSEGVIKPHPPPMTPNSDYLPPTMPRPIATPSIFRGNGSGHAPRPPVTPSYFHSQPGPSAPPPPIQPVPKLPQQQPPGKFVQCVCVCVCVMKSLVFEHQEPQSSKEGSKGHTNRCSR